MSSGMPVISTTAARRRPMAAPTTTAAASSTSPRVPMPRSTARPTVATRATVMPAMPYVLPVLAVSWRDSPASASTNSRAATRYAAPAADSTLTSG